MRYKKALYLSPLEFKRMYGITPETFWLMVEAVRDGKQGSRGTHASIPIPDPRPNLVNITVLAGVENIFSYCPRLGNA